MVLNILLTGCNSEYDMRLFISSLPSESVINTEYNLIDDSFANVDDWTNNGFTVNDGLEASGTGSINFYCESIYESYLDRQTAKYEVIVNDSNSKFSLGRGDSPLVGDKRGVATVDLSVNILYYGLWDSVSVEPSPYEWSEPITVPFVSGNTYVLELTKDRNLMIAKYYDKSNPNVYNQIYLDYGNENPVVYHADSWGKSRLIFFKGDIKIINFKYQNLVNWTPKISVYGDSYIEASSLMRQNYTKHPRWADKLYVNNNGNMTLSGPGGAQPYDMVRYGDFEQSRIIPTYTIYALGYNSTNFTDWKSETDICIDRILSYGSIPIMVTLQPRADRQAFINEVNDYVMNTSPYDYIDFARALTVNGDRLTWIPEYLWTDNVHPTPAGFQAMYDEIVANNSYLTE